MTRKIIHLDCDCFFAAVELRDRPALRQRPVAVGGDPARRGVIATCNYEARAFGVHSAMASAHALKLCPELVILAPDFDKYRRASRRIQQIFRQYTAQIEPLSLDEAYLDVSDCQLFDNSATRIAEAIRQEVKKTTQLTISAGIAPNKFLAKIASDWNKPDGIFTLAPDAIPTFIKQLPVKRIHGVGQATLKKMQALGLATCGDLQRISRLNLYQHFGSFGERLYHLCRGEDDRPVEASRRHKSVSVETTFAQDQHTLEDWLATLPELFADLERRFSRLDDSYTIASLVVKVKYQDFSQAGCQTGAKAASLEAFTKLVQQQWRKRPQPIRLLGLGLRLKDSLVPLQPDLFPEEKLYALQQQRRSK
jgi:DNA polymerase-4